MALALFMNKKGSTREARVRQPQKPVSKLIHNVSKCYQMEEAVCLPCYLQLIKLELSRAHTPCALQPL